MSDAAFPESGRLAGIDYGKVRIGIALTDPQRIVASPLEIYTRRNEDLDRKYFQELAEQEKIAGFVVGLPVHLSGDESPMSAITRKFAEWLNEVTGRPVCLFDERMTSSEAERLLIDAGMTKKRRQARLDTLAAQILLNAFLESQKRNDPPGGLDD